MRRFAIPLVVLALIAGSTVVAAAGPEPLTPMPGELVLTQALQTQALNGMSSEERKRRGAQWAEQGSLPVAYAQEFIRMDRDAVGHEIPVIVGGAIDPAPNLHLSSLATAATTGNASRYDLYISVAVVRQTCSGCYQWAIDNWVDWSGTSPQGLDAFNNTEESFGSSWAGGLYLWTDTSTGEYNSIYPLGVTNLDIYRSDASANAGVGWSFHEWRQTCGMGCFTAVNWADGTSYIRETSWAGRTDNVIHKYFHTYGANTQYSLGFPCCASVSISPTSNQWSVAAYASFSH